MITLLFYIIILSLSPTFICKNADVDIKRSIDATDLYSKLHEILLKKLISFPISSFESDPELVQKVNKKDQDHITTTYKFDGDEGYTLYKRDEDDNSKGVVLLTTKEDKIPYKISKRGYVVLRKDPVTAPYYFAEIAFVR
jgi:hypothetical protein